MIIQRQCVCGVPIPASRCLCAACAKKYTLRRDLWPLWLVEWMNNYQTELNYERRHGIYDVSLEMFVDDGAELEDVND